MEEEWKDVTYMSILDTDWLMRNFRVYRSAPKSLWDALFARHQREREELLRWEAKASLKRTSSMVTIRGSDAALTVTIPDSGSSDTSASDAESDNLSDHNPAGFTNGKRKAEDMDEPSLLPQDDRRLSCVFSSETEANLANYIVKHRVKRWVELSSPELSLDDILSDDILSDRSTSPDGSGSFASWDDMETCSTVSTASMPSVGSSNSSLFQFVDM
jgi:hypothetical protein